MSTIDSVVIDTSKENAGPSLEETAKEMGIDVNAIDDTAIEQQADVRPGWLPEKFKTAEDMANAYAELERKLGSRGKQDQVEDNSEYVEEDVDTSDDTTQEETSSTEDTARQVVENAGLDFDAMSERFWSNGQQVSEDDYKALEAAGIPRNFVDQFAEGQKAILSQERSEAFAIVGGEENYKDMIQWASKNLTDSEIKAYDNAVNGFDRGAKEMAIRGLAARYQAKIGFEPSRELGGTTRASAEVYESVAQLSEDMGNPKYKSDPAFRRRVEQKLARSDIF